jgi:hypothetical protein
MFDYEFQQAYGSEGDRHLYGTDSWLEPDAPKQFTRTPPELTTDGSMRLMMDKDDSIFDIRRRFQGWRSIYQSPINHAVASVLVNGHEQGFSLCKQEQHRLDDWQASQEALAYCPECLTKVANLFV